MDVPLPATAPRAALRLFSPDQASHATQAPNDLRLREAFERHLLPLLTADRRKRGTLDAYQTALRHWEQRTDDPPLRLIDAETLRAFVASFPPEEFSSETVKKHWRHLRPILRRCGPASDRNPLGLEILARLPAVRLPRQKRRVQRLASLAELDRLYDACRVAAWPRLADVPPPAYWRAALVALYTYGPRAFDLFCQSPAAAECPGWRWPGVSFATGTLRYTQSKTGDEIEVPLTRIAAAHLESIRTDRRAVFPATRSKRELYETWTRIKRTAGVGTDGEPDLDLHDLRRTCQTEWDWLRMGLGDFVLGHTPHDVGSTYYRNFARKAREVCEDLPTPAAFRSIFERVEPRQLALFS